ncbi:protein ZBED8 [Hyalella azteca]|uniref:Protein ZBED8 n=1 Tax=Hyalella azteca TaxID=294128 RepID=A0A8B7NRI8_HYAAZ|nr:protein ZBED8 [Hyalella azteca]
MAFIQQTKKKCRQYNVEYLKYGFIPAPHNQQQPMCLLCEKVFSNEAMKPSRLVEHLKRMHSDKADKNLTYFQLLQDKVQKRTIFGNMFASSLQRSTDGLRASYNISLLIARSAKPHTIGEELILPAIREVLHTVLHESPDQIIKAIPLSDTCVQGRIDEMAENIEETLCNMLRKTEFSLLLEESTLPGNESLLLAYVRFIKDESLVQELLFARQLETETKGESVFHVVDDFFKEKDVPLSNILACAADGAPSMVGRHCGFIYFLKKAVPGVLTVHCVIHRQHLVAKNLSGRLHKSMSAFITAINYIKVHAPNSRLFRQLCTDNDEEFERLFLHTEVRWLSKGNCLGRFYSLFDTVVEFFYDSNPVLCDELRNMKHDIAYLADIFTKFNEINLQLQGNESNLIKVKSAISTFLTKLQLFKRNIASHALYQFPSLSELDKEKGIADDDLQVYCTHLDELHRDMSERFEDILLLEIPDWVINPFLNVDGEETGVAEEELISIQNDIELRPKFKKSYQDFWLQKKISDCYKVLWNRVKMYFIAFPTSYLVERGSSAVALLLSKQRNRLKITDRGDLRLILSEFQPDVEKLISQHQAHPSHALDFLQLDWAPKTSEGSNI